MAYLQEDEEDKAQGLNQTLTPAAGAPGAPAPAAPEQEQPQAPQSSQPSTIGGGAAAPTTPTPAPRNAMPSTQSNAKAGSGSFTNLKKYLTANQGNRISGAASQKVANLATGAQKGITQASTAFGTKVEQGTLANRGQALQDIQATIGAARGVTAQPQVAAPVAPAKEVPVTPIAEAAATQQAVAATAQPIPPTATPETPTNAPATQEPQYLSSEQQSRFADIINAKYSGPESIRQAGLLEPAQTKVQEAARQGKNVQTAMGREELLRSMFGKNRDYTQGQSKLDSLLLNTSAEGVGQLKQAAQGTQQLTQDLQKAENTSQNLAVNRAKEISDIRNQSRTAFESGRTEEEVATEKRMTDLIETPVKDANGNVVLKQDGTPMTEWDKLPEHFRASLANKAAGAKTAKAERLADLEAQNQGAVAKVNQAASLKQQLDAATTALQKARVGKVVGASFGGGIKSKKNPIAISQAEAAQKALQSQYNAAQREAQAAQATPEYQQYTQDRAAVERMNENQWALSPEEAALLGVSSGEGLYNTQASDIKTVKADRQKLISQDEFARQQALSQLAGLDKSSALQKELKYQDRGQAGTQSLQDSLDTAAFRDQMNQAEEGFRENVLGSNITGVGSKKNKTSGKKYYAKETANLGSLLKKSGYDFDAPIGGKIGSVQDVANARGVSSGDVTQDLRGVSGATESMSKPFDGQGGQSVAADVGDLYGSVTGLNALTGALGLGSLGGAIGGLFGGGSSSKESKNDAQRFARRDLEKKIKAGLTERGYENRAAVVDTASTQAKAQALKDLLARKG